MQLCSLKYIQSKMVFTLNPLQFLQIDKLEIPKAHLTSIVYFG
jgi:hypothetical protein